MSGHAHSRSHLSEIEGACPLLGKVLVASWGEMPKVHPPAWSPLDPPSPLPALAFLCPAEEVKRLEELPPPLASHWAREVWQLAYPCGPRPLAPCMTIYLFNSIQFIYSIYDYSGEEVLQFPGSWEAPSLLPVATAPPTPPKGPGWLQDNNHLVTKNKF